MKKRQTLLVCYLLAVVLGVVQSLAPQSPAQSAQFQPIPVLSPATPNPAAALPPARWEDKEITELAEHSSAAAVSAQFGHHPEGYLLWLSEKWDGQSLTTFYLYGKGREDFHSYLTVVSHNQLLHKIDAPARSVEDGQKRVGYEYTNPVVAKVGDVLVAVGSAVGGVLLTGVKAATNMVVGGYESHQLTPQNVQTMHELLAKINIAPAGELVYYATQVVAGKNHVGIYHEPTGVFRVYQVFDRFGSASLTAQGTGRTPHEAATSIHLKLNIPETSGSPVIVTGMAPVSPVQHSIQPVAGAVHLVQTDYEASDSLGGTGVVGGFMVQRIEGKAVRDVKDLLRAVNESNAGNVVYYATQIVSGKNHAIIMKREAKKFTAYKIYQPLRGSPSVITSKTSDSLQGAAKAAGIAVQ